jgi:uncharacterized membrane protein YfcA
VFFQTSTSSYFFFKKGLLDWKRGLTIGIPVIIGCLIGSNISVIIDERVFNICFGLVLLLMLFFVFFNPEAKFKGNEELLHKNLDWKIILFFLFAGIYAGFVHIGVGYFFLAGAMWMLGYDLMTGNALKNFLLLLLTPFAVGFFIFNGDMTMKMAIYGLVHGIGNIIGASLATHFGMRWGHNFIRWLMLAVIILTALNMFEIIDASGLSKVFSAWNEFAMNIEIVTSGDKIKLRQPIFNSQFFFVSLQDYLQ